jgi:hypothetical protein
MASAGYQVSVATVDVSSREVLALVGTATGIGEIVGLIHAAGVSPSQASPETILRVDLHYGTALVLEEFGKVMARGGSGVVISSHYQEWITAVGKRSRRPPGHGLSVSPERSEE